ncbi:hypothetical protein Dsin_002034 [Dipteronia sinensis]|uniref:Uncharacterized protein n=1 Tax=Dipteronia sinensis TaxID=43782 RepID=A0AAE0EIW7_9ROSI|nr:hypothetical protein Dsin_002034 [Dipteronia sinensis]
MFKCAVSSSPTWSPKTSPVIHLRRRKTLRMLFNRRRFPRQDDDALDREAADVSPEIENKKIRAKLKNLFVSSPPFEERGSESNYSMSDGRWWIERDEFEVDDQG